METLYTFSDLLEQMRDRLQYSQVLDQYEEFYDLKVSPALEANSWYIDNLAALETIPYRMPEGDDLAFDADLLLRLCASSDRCTCRLVESSSHHLPELRIEITSGTYSMETYVRELETTQIEDLMLSFLSEIFQRYINYKYGLIPARDFFFQQYNRIFEWNYHVRHFNLRQKLLHSLQPKLKVLGKIDLSRQKGK
jgi:hypothetical protein